MTDIETINNLINFMMVWLVGLSAICFCLIGIIFFHKYEIDKIKKLIEWDK